MRRQELPFIHNEPDKKLLEVGLLNVVHLIEIAQTEEQLAEAKALDDLAFGPHLGVTMEELTEIMNHGAVLLLRDAQGQLIGESQVITSPTSQHQSLASDEAYNYGTAVHPALQNHGIAQILFRGQELVALEAGKTKNTLTARLENAPSLRGRFKSGYQVTGYDPNYYGSLEEGGARLIMEKNHLNQHKVFTPESLVNMATNGDVLIVDQENIEKAIQNAQSFIGIVINSGDQNDLTAHKLVAKIFDTDKFIGIGLLKPNELDISQTASFLILQHQ